MNVEPIKKDALIAEFVLDGSRWKKRFDGADTPNKKQDMVSELIRLMLVSFASINDNSDGRDKPDTMRATLAMLDKIGRSVVMASDGIIHGYSLHPLWVPILFAQSNLQAALELDMAHCVDEHFNRMRDTIYRLYDAYGWDSDLCINPTHNRLNTIHIVNVKTTMSADFGETCIEIKVILTPSVTNKYPMGSMWESTAGKIYECSGEENGHVIMVGENMVKQGRKSEKWYHPTLMMTQYQLKRWTRRKDIEI